MEANIETKQKERHHQVEAPDRDRRPDKRKGRGGGIRKQPSVCRHCDRQPGKDTSQHHPQEKFLGTPG